MIAATDWIGIGTAIAAVISAIFAGLAQWNSSRTHAQVSTPNGDPRTSGEVLSAIAEKVGVPEPAPAPPDVPAQSSAGQPPTTPAQ